MRRGALALDMSSAIAAKTFHCLRAHGRLRGTISGKMPFTIAIVAAAIAFAFTFSALAEGIDLRLVRVSSARRRRGELGSDLVEGAVGNQGEAHRVILALRL